MRRYSSSAPAGLCRFRSSNLTVVLLPSMYLSLSLACAPGAPATQSAARPNAHKPPETVRRMFTFMVFSRFLPAGSAGYSVYVNGRACLPWRRERDLTVSGGQNVAVGSGAAAVFCSIRAFIGSYRGGPFGHAFDIDPD